MQGVLWAPLPLLPSAPSQRHHLRLSLQVRKFPSETGQLDFPPGRDSVDTPAPAQHSSKR